MSAVVPKSLLRAAEAQITDLQSQLTAALKVVEAAEEAIADQDALYSVCPWCQSASPMHDADCEYRILRSALDALKAKETP